MNRHFGLPISSVEKRFLRKEREGWLPRGHIDGLILSNDITDSTNDIFTTAGSARSTVHIVDGSPSTLTRDQIDLDLPVGIVKQLDVAFAPENYDPEGYAGAVGADPRSGGRSSSALSNTTWHVLLAGGAGLQPDIFFHDSLTQSSILSEMQKIGGYTAYRHINSIVRRAAAVVQFTQIGDYVRLTTPIEDADTALSTTAVTYTAPGIPTGMTMLIKMNALVSCASGAIVYIRNLIDTDSAPSSSAAPDASLGNNSSSLPAIGQLEVWVNTSGQFAARAGAASTTWRYSPIWYRHPRGKDA